MDRRRYNPSAEGLEGRSLLSLFGGKVALSQNKLTLQDLPTTYKQKLLRVDHLPFFLRQENADRFLPADTMTSLKADVNAVVASLHAPTASAVNSYNKNLRHLLVQNTLSRTNVNLLENSMGSVLASAGATPEQTANLQADMLALAKVDALSVQPSTLARNDYSLVLQTALAVGRPMETATAPSISTKDGTRVKGGGAGYTRDHNPLMIGTYQAGATKVGYVRMQIIDSATGAVLGESPVDANGNYSVKLSTTLPDGKYALRSRAIDEVGHLSEPSPHAFMLRVFTPKHTRPTPADATATTTVTTNQVTTAATTPAPPTNPASSLPLSPPKGPLAVAR
jgi:hypothetical protein